MKDSPILLVEDDENDIFFFERAFEQAAIGRPLHVVRDGGEAIRYFSGDWTRFPLPWLIILDLNLPRKHGLEVLAWIRASAPDPVVPVIVLTSSMSDVEIREAYRLGANSFLNKPSQPQQLVEVLRVLKLYWCDFNRVPPPCGAEMLART